MAIKSHELQDRMTTHIAGDTAGGSAATELAELRAKIKAIRALKPDQLNTFAAASATSSTTCRACWEAGRDAALDALEGA